MEVPVWSVYAISSLLALVVALLVVPQAKALAFRYDVLDHPGGYKQQAQPVPYLGGAAVTVAAVAGVTGAGLMGLDFVWGQAAMVLAMSVLLAVVGLADDVKNLPPLPRLVAQAVAALVVILLGTRVELVDSLVFEVLLTLLWVVGITNGLNLLDNMDGLAAGVTVVASGWMFVMAAGNGQFLVAILLVSLFGATLGFLRHNFHPASVYLGDAGSLFLGFLLAVAGMRLRFDAPIAYTWLVPVLALGLPILDTSFVTFNRLRNGRNPLSGGRDHISHRLVQIGLPVRGAVLLLYGVAFVFGVLAFVVSRTADWSAYLVAGVAFGASGLGLIGLERRAGHHLVAGFEPQGETA
jgi:UDP-GlcNAc:undecaprenyl-phosphate GlcNAc-1-phosphate transferase